MSELLDPLFGDEDVSAAFTPRATVQAMLDVEVALAEALSLTGLISGRAVGPIRAAARAELFDLAALASHAARAGNLAIPLVGALTSRVESSDPEAARSVHWGATSQDVLDTALVLQLRASVPLIVARIERAADAAADQARRHAAIPMPGRTWLQHATPITFGLKAAGWCDGLDRVGARLATALDTASVLQLGGAAGTLASLGSDGLAVADAMGRLLSLRVPSIPWHAHRDRLADLAAALGIAVGELGKVGRDLALLAQTEVAEASEAAPGGSSTMPQKRNPVAASVALTVAIVGLAYLLKFRGTPAEIPAFTQSLAVLPLENLSGDPKQDFFSDGMTDALITDLAQIQTLRVISRTSVMQYKGTRNKSLPEIAKELNEGAVLEGTVLWSGDHVRITAQLIEAGTDRHLWAKNYERDLRDILALQSEVSQAVAEEIRVKMTSSEKARLAKFHPVKREAYEAYLRGMYDSEGNKEQFEKAIALDPNYAPAYAGFARFYFFSGLFGDLAPNVAFPKMRELVRTALQGDETLAEAHACLALVKVYYDWDWREAEKEFRLALKLNPGNGDVRHDYAHFLLAMNRLEESVAESKRAMELNPFDNTLVACVGWHCYFGHQYDQTIEYSLKALAMDQNNGFAHSMIGLAYEQKSMPKEAIAALKKGGDEVGLGHAFAVSGDKQQAEEVLAKFYEKRKQGYFSAYNIAIIHQGLGNKDQAFEWLQKAYMERSADLIQINGDPRFTSLRSDPRFQDLIKRIGLPS